MSTVTSRPQEELWANQTSGMSGTPLTVFYSQRFYLSERLLAVSKILARAGFEADPSADLHCLHVTDTRGPRTFMLNPVGVCTPSAVEVIDSSSDAAHRLRLLLERLRPAVITSRPELFELFVEHCRRDGVSTSKGTWHLISSGSSLDHERRGQIEAESMPRWSRHTA